MNVGVSMTLDEWNRLPADAAAQTLRSCCGSTRWVQEMVQRRPFPTGQALLLAADEVWFGLHSNDWQEAFAHHPRIGDLESVRKKFATTDAAREQAGALGASEDVLAQLAEGNRLYEEKFGYIFIVFATGKSAEEMLQILRVRLNNEPAEELFIAAAEQAKITRLRLQKLFSM